MFIMLAQRFPNNNLLQSHVRYVVVSGHCIAKFGLDILSINACCVSRAVSKPAHAPLSYKSIGSYRIDL